MRVVVLGGSGFVGSHVVDSLRDDHHEVDVVAAPRVTSYSQSPSDVLREASRWLDSHPDFSTPLLGADAVVNAAGLAEATGSDRGDLQGANALVPVLTSLAAVSAGVPRIVHVSSVAVQGRTAVLDESRSWQPFSPYSESKALAERAILEDPRLSTVVIYRPPSVQGAARKVTQRLHKIASSRLSVVGGSGRRPTPQVLVESVASAVNFLVTIGTPPPRIVMHPWEGMTTGSLMTLLGGGRRPRRIPLFIARGLVACAFGIARLSAGVEGAARRAEVLLLGQQQGDSWLTNQGWVSPVGAGDWRRLSDELGSQLSSNP